MRNLTKYNTMYNNVINPYKYFVFIMLIFIFIFIGLKSVKINKYYSNNGIIIDDNEIEVFVNRMDLKKVYDNNKIIINNKNFAYKINSISEPIFYNDYFYKVILKINLNTNMNIKNNYIDFKILQDKQTILEYIIKKIGG